MKKAAWTVGLLGAWGCLGTAGCADNESTLFIRQVAVPGGADCSFKADPGGAGRALGTLDVALRQDYVAGLLIGNQLVERGSADQIRVETSRVRLLGAEVSVRMATGAVLREYTVPVTGFVDPGTDSSPGWGVALAVLVDTETGESFRQQYADSGARDVQRLVVVAKVFGKTLGGQEVETGEFQFPINVCYGCLVSFPPDAADPALGASNCKAAGGDATGGLEVSCLAGQDDPVDCRICHAMGFGDEVCEPGG